MADPNPSGRFVLMDPALDIGRGYVLVGEIPLA
jgi:hypothetical protein